MRETYTPGAKTLLGRNHYIEPSITTATKEKLEFMRKINEEDIQPSPGETRSKNPKGSI